MLKYLFDNLTLLQSQYEKRLRPLIYRLEKLPGGDWVFGLFVYKFFRSLIFLVSRFSSYSLAFVNLQRELVNFNVAQIGGVTRSIFDNGLKLTPLNTHGWRSGGSGEDGGEYLKVEGIKLPLDNESVDAVASRHTLEHISNPIAALVEWKRVLKKGGYLYISVPDRRKTKEYRRELTSLEHFISDFNNNIPEYDPSHEEEIKKAGAGIIQHDRYENPYIHYHTFEEKNLCALLRYCGYKIIPLSARDLYDLQYQPWDLIVLAQKI